MLTELKGAYPIKRSFTAFKRHLHLSLSLYQEKNAPASDIIFSMLQPTGQAHLGNYLGALSYWKKIQDHKSPSTRLIYGIADLHSLTMPFNPSVLKKNRYETVATAIACGIDPEKSIIFYQSEVPQHTELNWILTCLTSIGFLNRMTQWKLKTLQIENAQVVDESVSGKVKAGLMLYPVLQAADVLLYKSTHVPVGEDQLQHLELCRHLASTFNRTFKSNFFPIPITLSTPSRKIQALRNPSKKMSKSDPDQSSSIYVTDEPDAIARKVRKATTDSIQGLWSFDPVQRPGISNLIIIVSSLTNSSIDQVLLDISRFQDHKQLKDYVAELLIEEFKEKRASFKLLLNDLPYLEKVTATGAEAAKEIALRNMAQIKLIMGLK